MNHYETLGIDRGAGSEEIKAAWRRASSAAHPDRAGGDTAQQQAVNLAYQVLSDPDRRVQYDASLETYAEAVSAAAQRILADVLEVALRKGVHPVAHAQQELAVRAAHLDKTRAAGDALRKLLERQRGLVRVVSGPNLADEIIDRVLADLAREDPALDRAFDVNRRAVEMLSLYILPEQTLTQGQIAERRANGLPLYV